jgi:hypothetical protein
LTIASQDARKWSIADGLCFKKSVQAAEQDRQRDDGQEQDHDKGDGRSISCFLSVWIRLGSTPLCGSCKINKP